MSEHDRCSRMILLFSVLALAATGAAQTTQVLQGTWRAKDAVAAIVLVLNADGTGKLDEGAIKYRVQDNTLIVDENGVVNRYAFVLQGNVLTLSGGDLEKPMAFERQGTGPVSGIGGRIKQAGAANTESPSPLGIWETTGPNGSIRLELKADGTGVFGGGPVRWQFHQGQLSLTGPNNQTIAYDTVLTSTSLSVSGGGLAAPVVFRSVESKAPSSTPKDRTSGDDHNGLVGRWQGPEGIVEVKKDGTMLIANTPYRYMVQGSTLVLIAADGTLPVPFKLNGDSLEVVLSGRPVTLKRIAAGALEAPSAPGSAGAELVGKWCYFSSFNATSGGGSMTDECFTINPNGTYVYHREGSISAYVPGGYGATASQTDDSGTWSLNGTTLLANSRTQGQASYSLEKKNHPKTGDPMLCLDGRCFVTYYQHPPWR